MGGFPPFLSKKNYVRSNARRLQIQMTGIKAAILLGTTSFGSIAGKLRLGIYRLQIKQCGTNADFLQLNQT